MSRTAHLARIAALAAGLAACQGEITPPSGPVDTGPRTPTGVSGKPLRPDVGGLAIADELVVGMQPGVSEADAALAALDAGGEVVWRGPGTGYYVVRFDDAAAAAAGALQLASNPAVADVVPSRVGGGTGVGTSPGPVDLQWNLRALDLDPARGWDTAGGIRVAVLDTGVAFEDYADGLGAYAVAPDLAATPIDEGWDFINDDAHANDDQGHGTHIAGVIAASAEHGIKPIAEGAEIMPIKVLDAGNQGTELALAEGILWAVDHGAQVINMSLAFPPTFYPSRFLQAAIDSASRAGVVMVAAVGNHGANVVTYPAAFREVIAVGASRLKPGYHPDSRNDPWRHSQTALLAAPYSNRGARVDVSAPGGMIDGDVDHDGNPEAVLAQTFQGDPTDFDYYFFAGTSQAAAQVSGLAAVMLAENPDLTPFEIRQIIGETARKKYWKLLADDIGRGFVQADDAVRKADDHHQPRRTRFFATTYLTIQESGGERWGDAVVEVVDQDGQPARWTKVWGSFTGGVYQEVSGWTNRDGKVHFVSDKLTTSMVLVGFQVEAVANGRDFDRPGGFVRIDSCSLEMLTAFAVAQGVGTSPGPNLLTLNYALVPNRPATQIDTLTLLNFTSDLATMPTTVAVDASWFYATYPEAPQTSVASTGTGVGTSPIRVLSAASFDPSVTLPWTEAPAPCSDLLVHTFVSANATDMTFPPLTADPAGSCDSSNDCNDIDGVLYQLWMAWGAGVGTSPPPTWGQWTGISQQAFLQLEAMTKSYADFASEGAGSPVEGYGTVLSAAGIAVTPITTIDSGGTGVTAMSN